MRQKKVASAREHHVQRRASDLAQRLRGGDRLGDDPDRSRHARRDQQRLEERGVHLGPRRADPAGRPHVVVEGRGGGGDGVARADRVMGVGELQARLHRAGVKAAHTHREDSDLR